MFKIALTFGWQSPIWPKWDDDSEGGKFTKRSFLRWLINVNIDGIERGPILVAFRLLGFYFTIYLSLTKVN